MTRKREDEAWAAFKKAYDLFEKGRRPEARIAYERAAALGSIPALVNLANYYDEGAFGRRNRKRAILLLKKAVAMQSPEAAYSLAHLYRADKMIRWQKHWLRRAAELGDREAPAELKDLNKSMKVT